MGTKFSKSYFTRVHSLVERFVTSSFPENEGEIRSRYLKKKISSAVKEKNKKKLALDYIINYFFVVSQIFLKNN